MATWMNLEDAIRKKKYCIVPLKREIRAGESREMMEGPLPEGESMRN